MKCQLFVSTLFAALLTSLFAPKAEAIQAYAIQDHSILVSFDTATPGVVTTIGFNGAATQLDGIDFRPANGLLYGYDQGTNQIVTVNTTTGFTTFVSNLNTVAGPIIPATSELGIDFNPMADRLRLVNLSDENWAINVGTGGVTVQTALNYGGDDANIIEVAYSNNLPAAASTTIYYIDNQLSALATATNPGTGPFSTIGPLGVDLDGTRYVGFDIHTTLGGEDTAYAILSDEFDFPRLYTIDLTSGTATEIGIVGFPEELNEVFSLALVPVPEPSSLCLLTIAGAAAFRYRRRK